MYTFVSAKRKTTGAFRKAKKAEGAYSAYVILYQKWRCWAPHGNKKQGLYLYNKEKAALHNKVDLSTVSSHWALIRSEATACFVLRTGSSKVSKQQIRKGEIFWKLLSVRPHQIEKCPFQRTLFGVNASRSRAQTGRHLARCSLRASWQVHHVDTSTVTNKATDTAIRYVIGLTVYTVRIYSTKASFKSETTLITLVWKCFVTMEVLFSAEAAMAPCEMYFVNTFNGDIAHISIAGKAEALLKAFLFKDFIKTNDKK